MSWRLSAGLRPWLLQRLSAVYLLLFLSYALFVWRGGVPDFEAWRAWVAHPAVNIGLALFFAALLLHAWVGGRDVAMDYVRPYYLRYAVLVALGLGLVAMGLWVLRILLTVPA